MSLVMMTGTLINSFTSWIWWFPAFLSPSAGIALESGLADLLYCLEEAGEVVDEEKSASVSVVWFVRFPAARRS